MKTEAFHLELITPCFCGGAEPDRQAEIRAPSIRGQLRWWFRTLAGFKTLAAKGMSVRDQENLIFGSTAGGEGRAGKLIVRVTPPAGRKLDDSASHTKPDMASPEGYLLFPLRQQTRRESALPSFSLHIVWRGVPALWDDLHALVAVFGHIGALGFRGRRAMGALAFRGAAPPLRGSLAKFSNPTAVKLMVLKTPAAFQRADLCIPKLGEWLRAWRQHGRSSQQLTINQPGFDYARRDHNEGARRLSGEPVPNNPPGHEPRGKDGDTFRPAIGLPIIQFFSSAARGAPNKVNWDFNTGRDKGRFASPVILRPHRTGPSEYRPLVIFVDAHVWPTGHGVHLGVQGRTEERKVSVDLYEAMKNDKERLTTFP